MDANVSFTGNLGTDVEMKIGEGWRGARFRVAHTPRGPDLSRLPATCRRPEKRAEAPLGDDRVVRYHDSPDGVDEDAEVVDDDVEMVGS